VATHATVTDIAVTHAAGQVCRVKARSLTGNTTVVRGGIYVLAAGGIENPRLLLASRSVAAAGLGNAHDQVGRYFMEHPHARCGRIVGGKAWSLLAAFNLRRCIGGETIAPLIAPGAMLQKREGLLNTSLTIAPRPPASGRRGLALQLYMRAKHDMAPTRRGRTAWKGVKLAAAWAKHVSHPFRPWLLHRPGKTELSLLIRAEQSPNPDSRVTLSKERDALGLQKPVLNWRLSALDVDSAAGLVRALGREAQRLDLGKVEMEPWLEDRSRRWNFDHLVSSHPVGGFHHMGTTRISSSPRSGVTDGHARVHGVRNLYIAGSSLFPTAGWANPTLTIAALSLRLADHLLAGGGI
jgi:choline dehydrogenase-like flavoprotein